MHAVMIVNGAALIAPEKEIVVIRPPDKVGLDDLILSVHEHVDDAVRALYAYKNTFERDPYVRNACSKMDMALDTKTMETKYRWNY